jgi:hypothetical protein
VAPGRSSMKRSSADSAPVAVEAIVDPVAARSAVGGAYQRAALRGALSVHGLATVRVQRPAYPDEAPPRRGVSVAARGNYNYSVAAAAAWRARAVSMPLPFFGVRISSG